VSENAGIEWFEPHVSATAESGEPRVWAIDTRHLPLYWFPRDCPRGTFWATPESTPQDSGALLGGAARIHVVEAVWLDRIRSARVLAYRLPEDSFEPDQEVGGYWVSRKPVVPDEVVELGDLLTLHATAGIELRVVPNIWPIWDLVVSSTLEFSGMRLRNARPRPG
jgi:hypothetical protein